MLEAIYVQGDLVAARRKAGTIVTWLHSMKLGKSAELAVPERWRRIRTNNPVERIKQQSTRSTIATAFASLVITLSLLVGVASPIGAQGNSRDAPPTYAVTKPRNLFDLMRNMHIAADSGLLLRPDFYTDSNLKQFFGGDSIRWDENNGDATRVRGYVHDFAGVAAPTPTPDGRSLDALTLSFRRSINSEGAAKADWLIYIPGQRTDRPSFADIESLFGTRWTPENDQPWPIHKPHRLPTAPHGNDRIMYRVADSGTEGELRFAFAFDGRLELATVEMKSLPR